MWMKCVKLPHNFVLQQMTVLMASMEWEPISCGIVDEGQEFNWCVAIEPMIMMKFVCKLTKATW